MPDAALLDAIRAILSGCPFHGEGHRKVWARLRMGGVRTSKRRVLRLMGEHGLLAPTRVGSPRGPRNLGVSRSEIAWTAPSSLTGWTPCGALI